MARPSLVCSVGRGEWGRGPWLREPVLALLSAPALLVPAATGAGSWDDAWNAASGAAGYSQSSAADLDTGSSGATIETTEFQLAGGTRLPLANPMVGSAGVDYQYTHYGYSNVTGRDRDLHRLQLPLSLERRSSNRTLRGVLAPGVATSSNVFKDPFGELTADDLLVTASLESAWELNSGSAAHLGLAYDRGFGDPAVYPVAGVEYCRGGRMKVRLAFPDPAVSVGLGNRHTVEARLYPAGNQWHVVSEEIDDDFDYEMRALRAQLTWSWRAGKTVTLDIAGGLEFGRHHEFTDDTRTRVVADADDEMFLVIGIRSARSPLPYSQGRPGAGHLRYADSASRC